jgi:hypothetical protein
MPIRESDSPSGRPWNMRHIRRMRLGLQLS